MTTPPFQLEGLEDQWVNHFSQLEAGTPTSMPQLLRTCVTRQMCTLFDAPSRIECQELPSLFALEDAFRKTAPDRATGDDPLPSELFHLAACPLAAGYHDLLLKEFVWQMEPLPYKGGPSCYHSEMLGSNNCPAISRHPAVRKHGQTHTLSPAPEDYESFGACQGTWSVRWIPWAAGYVRFTGVTHLWYHC